MAVKSPWLQPVLSSKAADEAAEGRAQEGEGEEGGRSHEEETELDKVIVTLIAKHVTLPNNV